MFCPDLLKNHSIRAVRPGRNLKMLRSYTPIAKMRKLRPKDINIYIYLNQFVLIFTDIFRARKDFQGHLVFLQRRKMK